MQPIAWVWVLGTVHMGCGQYIPWNIDWVSGSVCLSAINPAQQEPVKGNLQPSQGDVNMASFDGML